MPGGIRTNPDRPLLSPAQLDRLPFPARDLLVEYGSKRANVCYTRGCRGACTFCSIRQFHRSCPGPAFRSRSPDSLLAELEQILLTYGRRAVHFVDASLLADREGVAGLCRELIASGFSHKMRFLASARADDVIKCADLVPLTG